ncbi:MAG: ABC transporter permease, partial [Solirubrobacteraceae bacterium]
MGAAASPWRAALRAIGRSWSGRIAVLVLVLVVGSSLAAPVWADHVAHTGPLKNHLADYVTLHGQSTPVVAYDGVPLGPTWTGRYFLGADGNGRDVMVRLLYGGRNSLAIGLVATLISLLVGVTLGILAGYLRGFTDGVISRALDVLWAFPVIVLGIALGVATALGGLNLGVVTIHGGSIWMTAFIIGLINIVYVARPLRGAVLVLREQPFVEAARSQGFGAAHVMRREILPNVSGTVLALTPIVLTQTIAIEASLSFLGAGVQQPNPSWGTMLDDGIKQLIGSPHLTLVPGGILVATVLSLTVLADLIRDGIDPRGVSVVAASGGAGTAGGPEPLGLEAGALG